MSYLPSVTSTQHELPFSQLSPEQFERLCMRLIEARGYKRIEHLGRAGNEQGRDIVAWDGVTRVAVQCKRVQVFTAADGAREIKKLLTLSHASRPHRVIFMVTCSISSQARDQIRRVWGGNEESCVFVAVTELDAEVRRNDKILREFFQAPDANASSADDRHNHDIGGQQREVPNELSRIEIINRDWIVRTRSFQFQRLLQAIQELEYPVGRLEASRALNLAVRKSGADKKATEQNLLRACEYLDANNLFQLEWTLRRTLARVIGDVIGLFRAQRQRVIEGFCEPRLTTRRGVLLLAEAASEHTAAASAIGKPILRRLLTSKHPQAQWQLLRRWPLVSPIVPNGIDLEEISEAGNVSVRRMLFLTRLQNARNSNVELSKLLGAASEGLIGVPGDSADIPFHNALRAWATLNTAVDVSGRSTARSSFWRINEVLQVASWSGHKSGTLVNQIAQSLELDSIERDFRNAIGSYQTHPHERYSEGRYGYTRHYVRWSLRVVPRAHIIALLLKLLHCIDEGIRWAVAAEVRNWWMLVSDPDAAINFVLRLVSDEHPWVVREVLQQLALDPLLCQAIGLNSLIQQAEESMRRAQAEGWETSELVTALRRVAAHVPI